MKPYTIDKIVDPITEEVKLEHKPEEVGKPVTKETAAQVRQLLERVLHRRKEQELLIKSMAIQLVVKQEQRKFRMEKEAI